MGLCSLTLFERVAKPFNLVAVIYGEITVVIDEPMKIQKTPDRTISPQALTSADRITSGGKESRKNSRLEHCER